MSGLLCFEFGAYYVTVLFGSGIWVPDAYGVAGKAQPVAPPWGADGFDPFNPGVIEAPHISVEIFVIFAGIFHIQLDLLNVCIKRYVWVILKLFYLVVFLQYFLLLL